MGAERDRRLEGALRRIAKWFGEFPETGRFFDKEKTDPMSYAACWGSNGERDFMRKVAQDALDGPNGKSASEERQPGWICDECMAGLVENGMEPHGAIFGANGTRWEKKVCLLCGKETDCVRREDLPVQIVQTVRWQHDDTGRTCELPADKHPGPRWHRIPAK